MDLPFLQWLRDSSQFGAPPVKPIGLKVAIVLQCGLIAGCLALIGCLAFVAVHFLTLLASNVSDVIGF